MLKNGKPHSLTALLLLALPSPAYAYLDPGSISIALQGILAGLAGLAATYRLWIYKIKSLFTFAKKDNLKDKENKAGGSTIND
tara:strand:- start:59 stop:307 length:249 start_codon:yes stop_codon:yes gene_type:complete